MTHHQYSRLPFLFGDWSPESGRGNSVVDSSDLPFSFDMIDQVSSVDSDNSVVDGLNLNLVLSNSNYIQSCFYICLKVIQSSLCFK